MHTIDSIVEREERMVALKRRAVRGVDAGVSHLEPIDIDRSPSADRREACELGSSVSRIAQDGDDAG
jgi:hypothetical protein